MIWVMQQRYAPAKGGIIAFTRKLAHELGPFGITVNAIAPSLTLTERIRPRWEQHTPDEQADEIGRTPLRRRGARPGARDLLPGVARCRDGRNLRVYSDATDANRSLPKSSPTTSGTTPAKKNPSPCATQAPTSDGRMPAPGNDGALAKLY
jgi:NAD(P)-dependent dehydrogenase (short-subunit alcohol dehydrogenase family)